MIRTNKLDRICIVVNNLAEARKVWEPLLDKDKPDHEYVNEPEKIRVARYWIGEVGFELMESTTPYGAVAKFTEKRGEGIMLVSLNVNNTREAVKDLQCKGYPFMPASNGEIARPVRDCEFAFVRRKKLNGVLTEIIDFKGEELK
jgi:methylmalonyl-CoA/ethylmalonyl-CoA epimerase